MKIIKLLAVLLIVAIIAGFVAGTYANDLRVILSKLGPGGNPATITFKISYAGFISLGEAVIINKGLEDFGPDRVYHLSARVKPNKLADYFYKITANADSFIDRHSLCPLKFRQELIISGKTKDEKIILYDQKNQVMEINNKKRVILPNTYDPLSAMLRIMNQDLTLGKAFDMNINTSQKNYRLLANVMEKRQLQIGKNIFDVYLLKGSVARRDKSLRHSSKFELWILDKPKKIILTAKIYTNIGLITIRHAN